MPGNYDNQDALQKVTLYRVHVSLEMFLGKGFLLDTSGTLKHKDLTFIVGSFTVGPNNTKALPSEFCLGHI